VRALGLETSAEMAAKEKGSREKRAANMRRNGATDEEIEFLLDRRVELNAMTSDQFVEFIERGLTEHGVRKVVPKPDMLAEVFRAHCRCRKLKLGCTNGELRLGLVI
jgi:hypothetical protein